MDTVDFGEDEPQQQQTQIRSALSTDARVLYSLIEHIRYLAFHYKPE